MRDFEHHSPYLVSPYRVEQDDNLELAEILFAILKQGEQIMTDITALTNDVATLTTAVANTKTALDDLASKVAGLTAGAVSQDQIDALDASVTAATSALNTAVATDDPAPAAPSTDAPVAPADTSVATPTS